MARAAPSIPIPIPMKCPFPPNGAADKLREGGPLAGQTDRQLQPLDGRRGAPGRKRMAIRSVDGAARSVRAIICFSRWRVKRSEAKPVSCKRLLGRLWLLGFDKPLWSKTNTETQHNLATSRSAQYCSCLQLVA